MLSMNLLIMQNGEKIVIAIAIINFRTRKAFSSVDHIESFRGRLSQGRLRYCSILYEQYPFARHRRTGDVRLTDIEIIR